MSKYTYFVGIDVAKEHLDYAVVQDGEVLANQRGDNTPKGILKTIKGLQKQLKGLTIANSLFCLAHTGIYTYPLLSTLKKEGADIWLEQVIQIERFLGVQRGKSDREGNPYHVDLHYSASVFPLCIRKASWGEHLIGRQERGRLR